MLKLFHAWKMEVCRQAHLSRVGIEQQTLRRAHQEAMEGRSRDQLLRAVVLQIRKRALRRALALWAHSLRRAIYEESVVHYHLWAQAHVKTKFLSARHVVQTVTDAFKRCAQWTLCRYWATWSSVMWYQRQVELKKVSTTCVHRFVAVVLSRRQVFLPLQRTFQAWKQCAERMRREADARRMRSTRMLSILQRSVMHPLNGRAAHVLRVSFCYWAKATLYLYQRSRLGERRRRCLLYWCVCVCVCLLSPHRIAPTLCLLLTCNPLSCRAALSLSLI